MTMRMLVTGGAGFIGSHLTDYLIAKGHEVIIVDDYKLVSKDYINPQARFFDFDIRNKQGLRNIMRNVDVVYHCAAYAAEIMSMFKPVFVTETNVIGSMNVIKEAINANVKRFVFLSSNAVHGYQAQVPYPENVELRPEDIYGIGKLAIEQSLRVFEEVYKMPYTIVRPHNVFGERQNLRDPYRNVIGIWMNRILRGEPPIIYGDGKQMRSFTYVHDLVQAIADSAFIKLAENEVFNIGSDEPITLTDAATKVCKVMDYKGKPTYADARPQEVKISYPSHEKAKKILGYHQEYSFDAGLEKMAAWAKTQPPRQFVYWDEVEISKRMPKVWRDRLI